jgi:hypothetical protein
MTARAELIQRARAAAEEGMVDTCIIRRSTGETTDQASGVVTPTYLSPNPYTGKCRVQQSLAQADQHDAGEDYQLQLRLTLQLPMSVIGAEVGDQVTITASRDPDLVGRAFLIRDLFHKTDASARRIGITERTD